MSSDCPPAFSTRRLPEGHIVTAQGKNFGYVVLPRCSAKDNDGLLLYAADVRRILSDLSAQNPRDGSLTCAAIPAATCGPC